MSVAPLGPNPLAWKARTSSSVSALTVCGIALGGLAVRVIGPEHHDGQGATGQPRDVVGPLEQVGELLGSLAVEVLGIEPGRFEHLGQQVERRLEASGQDARRRPRCRRVPRPRERWRRAASKASASSVAVRLAVPWSSSVAVRCASPDLPAGSSPVPTGTRSESLTSGKVFQRAIQRSIPLESVRRT